jgi:hypothetical protein
LKVYQRFDSYLFSWNKQFHFYRNNYIVHRKVITRQKYNFQYTISNVQSNGWTRFLFNFAHVFAIFLNLKNLCNCWFNQYTYRGITSFKLLAIVTNTFLSSFLIVWMPLSDIVRMIYFRLNFVGIICFLKGLNVEVEKSSYQK